MERLLRLVEVLDAVLAGFVFFFWFFLLDMVERGKREAKKELDHGTRECD